MRKMAWLILFSLLCFSSLWSASTQAASGGQGFMIGVSGIKLDETYDGNTVGTSETTRTVADIKAGVVTASGLYLGGVYDSRTDESSGSKQERTAYGATVGYHSGGWFLDGSFFLDSTLKLSSATKVEKGSGIGIDLGRNFDLTSNTYTGLQISYKSISYTQVNGVEASNKLKSELCPMLNLGVMF